MNDVGAKMKFDEIGYWSEMKLEIIKKYASKYSLIIENQRKNGICLEQIYIDAFAGGGFHIAKETREVVQGSPMVALKVEPPFRSLHFVDLDGDKADQLRGLTAGMPAVHVYHGDCNDILLTQILPHARYDDYKRALCLLDPYGLHLNWQVIKTAGEMGSVEVFLNFPVMDMNRNVLWANPSGVDPEDVTRMTNFWGDETWKDVAYDSRQDLFGHPEKQSNDVIAKAFQERLRSIAGFRFVPKPLAMKNSVGSIVYYLFFASPNRTGGKIVEEIFAKYKNRGGAHGRKIPH